SRPIFDSVPVYSSECPCPGRNLHSMVRVEPRIQPKPDATWQVSTPVLTPSARAGMDSGPMSSNAEKIAVAAAARIMVLIESDHAPYSIEEHDCRSLTVRVGTKERKSRP